MQSRKGDRAEGDQQTRRGRGERQCGRAAHDRHEGALGQEESGDAATSGAKGAPYGDFPLPGLGPHENGGAERAPL